MTTLWLCLLYLAAVGASVIAGALIGASWMLLAVHNINRSRDDV